MICDIGEILRSRKNKAEFITINTINSQSNDRNKKSMIDSKVISLLKQKLINESSNIHEDVYGLD